MRAFVLSVALFFVSSARADDAVLLDGVAARVDDRIIFVSEVRARAPTGGPATRLAVESLIESALVENEATRRHLEVSTDEVKKARAAIANDNGLNDKQLSAMIRKTGMTETLWEGLLREQILEGKLVQLEIAKDAKDPRPTNRDELDAWIAKRRAAMVQRLRDAAFIEVRI